MPNSTTGGYDASLTIGIAAPVTGIINLEPETGGQFRLKQNYPNPHQGKTTIPFVLTNAADVNIELWDLTGKKVAEIAQNDPGEGEHEILIDLKSMGLPAGNYVYQFQVSNSNGVFRQCKMMTWQ